MIGANYAGTKTAPPNGLLVEGNVGIALLAGELPQNNFDVEGKAVIGAGYAGSAQAPTNGLLVEGNVGIGIQNPGSKLDVMTTNTAANNILKVQGPTPGADPYLVVQHTNTPLVSPYQVGIGFSDPVNQLDVKGNVYIGGTPIAIPIPPVPFTGGLVVEGTVGIGSNPSILLPTNFLSIADLTGAGAFIDSFHIKIGVGPGSDYFKVKNTGRVGIGTANPQTRVHVTENGATDPLRIDVGAYPAMTVKNDGKVGLGIAAPAERLDLGGGNIKMGYEIVTAFGLKSVNALCPAGKRVIGGGFSAAIPPPTPYAVAVVHDSFPILDDTWHCGLMGPPTLPITCYAICANIR